MTPKQIDRLELSTCPTKLTDSRGRSLVRGSAELDAIDPETLKKLVTDALDQQIDKQKFEKAMIAERA